MRMPSAHLHGSIMATVHTVHVTYHPNSPPDDPPDGCCTSGTTAAGGADLTAGAATVGWCMGGAIAGAPCSMLGACVSRQRGKTLDGGTMACPGYSSDRKVGDLGCEAREYGIQVLGHDGVCSLVCAGSSRTWVWGGSGIASGVKYSMDDLILVAYSHIFHSGVKDRDRPRTRISIWPKGQEGHIP